MGINSQGVAYNFGQMGSGHLMATGTDLKPPHGRVIVAITMINSCAFTHLVADDTYTSTKVDTAGSLGDGVVSFGTQTQTRANGLDNGDDTSESVAIGTGILFPAGLTIYGRWNRVKLSTVTGDDGCIIYYGPE